MDSGLLALILLPLLFLLLIVLLLLRVVRRRRAARAAQAQVSVPVAKSSEGKPASKTPRKIKKKLAGDASKSGPAPASPNTSTKILGGPEQNRALPAEPKQGYAPEGEKIRILIVDDNTGTRENVSRLLYFENDLEVIGQAVNGRQGVEMAESLKPHIVLMDINMPDMDGITATGEMATRAPYSQVIIMSVQADQHYMKRAMAAGARDFQPKPFTSDELVSCIRRVYNIGLPVYQQLEALEHARAQPSKPSKSRQQADGANTNADRGPVIAVYSPKGGAGTSALASNLAVAFQQQLGDTVLVDGALQAGDISVHLNTRPERSIADTVHDDRLEVDLLDDVLMAHHSGLKLLLAPPQPELAESFNGKMMALAMGALSDHHNAVVVDTTPQLTDVTLSILEKASYILVVTTPELPAIKSVKLFLELAEQLHFDMSCLFVVINRADLPGGIPPAQIEKVLQLKHTFRIPNDTKLHFALNRGASICLTEPSAASSSAIVSLAKDLRQRISSSKKELAGAA